MSAPRRRLVLAFALALFGHGVVLAVTPPLAPSPGAGRLGPLSISLTPIKARSDALSPPIKPLPSPKAKAVNTAPPSADLKPLLIHPGQTNVYLSPPPVPPLPRVKLKPKKTRSIKSALRQRRVVSRPSRKKVKRRPRLRRASKRRLQASRVVRQPAINKSRRLTKTASLGRATKPWPGPKPPGKLPAPVATSGAKPMLGSMIRPPYPELARRRGWEGRVILRVLVGADGRVTRVLITRSSGHTVLDSSARRVVKRWRFRPARRLGAAVEAWVLVPIRFRIDDDE